MRAAGHDSKGDAALERVKAAFLKLDIDMAKAMAALIERLVDTPHKAGESERAHFARCAEGLARSLVRIGKPGVAKRLRCAVRENVMPAWPVARGRAHEPASRSAMSARRPATSGKPRAA